MTRPDPLRRLVTLGTLGALLLPIACAPVAESGDRAAARSATATLSALEARTGGRLGVVMRDAAGTMLLAHRADERFAMCSTFKAALAAAILHEVDEGRLSLSQPIAFGPADIVPYAPVTEAALARGSLTVAELIDAAVRVSDNVAANLLLARIGGPAGFNRLVRSAGDATTRFDRTEPALNENAPGDPRDTTTPAAGAALLHAVLLGDVLSPASHERLERLMRTTTTGAARIPAGLPPGWRAAHKTGTCATAVNDVAFIRPPVGPPYVLTILLDRPTVANEAAEAALAEVSSISARRAAWH